MYRTDVINDQISESHLCVSLYFVWRHLTVRSLSTEFPDFCFDIACEIETIFTMIILFFVVVIP